MLRHSIRLLAAAAACCLALAPAASADRLGWQETAKAKGAKVMVYRVDSLTFGPKRWSAHVSIRNLSKKPIKIGKSFGIAFWLDGKNTSLAQAVGRGLANKFSKEPPAVLRPGATWTGVMSGLGTVPKQLTVYARLFFGSFSPFPGRSQPILWITDHAHKVGAATKKKTTTPVAGPVA
jgi:hypothetical protein